MSQATAVLRVVSPFIAELEREAQKHIASWKEYRPIA